ncbi:MAG: class I SAM-dependent methyltransferase, partial [Steroidobacteraceae bacterium]
ATAVPHGPGGFMNLGLWEAGTRSRTEASETLMARIVEGIVRHGAQGDPARAKVLDVACDLGGTTLYLSRTWPADGLYGINLTEDQLAVCETRAPGCHFLRMDAARLGFPDSFFDHVVCVEAAFYFKTRRDFLMEAHRVLKPGGVLALTDMLFVPEMYDIFPAYAASLPAANELASLAEYELQLREVGFSHCYLRDITEEGWRRYFPFSAAQLHRDWAAGRLRFAWLQQMLDSLYVMECAIDTQLLCFAVK